MSCRQQSGATALLSTVRHPGEPVLTGAKIALEAHTCGLRLLAAAGVEPVLMPSTTGNARYIDRYCDALADHIRDDPTVLETAKVELDEMRPDENVRVWRRLLEAGPSAVVAVLTSRDPDARGLKADNPFARLGLIAEAIRLSLLDQARGR